MMPGANRHIFMQVSEGFAARFVKKRRRDFLFSPKFCGFLSEFY